MNNQTDIGIKFENKVVGQDEIKKYADSLKKITTYLSTLDGKAKILGSTSKSVANNFKATSKAVDQVTKSTKQASSSADDLYQKFKGMFTVGKIIASARAIKSLASGFTNLIAVSANYLENLNLVDVAFHNNTASADTLTRKLSEMYGLDESWGYRTIGIFKQLGNAMGLAEETSTKLAKTMTFLSIDTASLYNMSVEESSNALQSALAGQTKPVRGRFGADITQATLQSTLDRAKIDADIASLSYVEKRLVIVASLLQQTKVAQNDWGRTIESVANQMRIFEEQTSRLSRAIGNVFLPIIKTVLPYLNGILMALVEITNFIAKLVGFNEEDFDFNTNNNIDSLNDLYDSIDGVSSGLDEANENAKKLKLSLRSFDKLNNITTPTTSTKDKGGGSGGIGGAINPDILKLFNDETDKYLKNLDKIDMKAKRIRDKIMEILGFHKEVNQETGEIEWKYDGFKKTLSNLLDIYVNMSTPARIITSAIGLMIATKTLTGLKNFIGVFLKTPLGTLFQPFKDLGLWLKIGAEEGWGKGSGFHKLPSTIKGIGAGFKEWKNSLNTLQLFQLAIVGISSGLILTNKGLDDINKGKKWQGFLEFYGGTVALSGTLGIIGSRIKGLGQYGGAIGILMGQLIGLYQVIKDGEASIEKAQQSTIDRYKKYQTEINNLKESAKYSIGDSLLEIESTEVLINKLEEYVDANGKVLKGKESAVEYTLTKVNEAYGTEYKLVDGQITIKGKEKVSIDKLKEATRKLIEQKKREIILDAYKDTYIKALKQQKDINDEIARTEQIIADLKERQSKTKDGKEWLELEGAIRRNQEALKNLQGQYNDNQTDIREYEDLLEATFESDTKKFDKALEHFTGEQNTHLQTSTEKVRDEFFKTTDLLFDNTSQKITRFIDNLRTNGTKINIPFLVNGKTIDELPSYVQKYINKGKYSINVDAKIKTVDFVGNIGNTAIDIINSMFKKDGGIYDGKSWRPIPQYAQGTPNSGQLFFANERGAELVAHIGGQTFVANQNQVMGMAKREMSKSNGTEIFNIYLDRDKKLATYTLDELKNMARSNGKPMTIG